VFCPLLNRRLEKANASRALNDLVASKKLSAKFHNRKQIYFASKNPNQTDHNLAVRDLYIKIILSGFEVEQVQFNLSLGGTLNPDLAVSFRAEDGGQIQTYWEYDAGNEGLEVLRSKVQRYRLYAGSSRICFVFATPKRLEQAKQDFGADFITYAVLEEFKSLNDQVFRRADSETGEPFFINTPYDNSHNVISINT
jgi:Replication-relaxation